MADLAVVELAVLIVALAFSYLHVYLLKRRGNKRSYADELYDQFNAEWNGRDDDEIYAWYRVRYKVVQFDEEGRQKRQKLEFIENLIRRLSTRPMRSKTSVSEKGLVTNHKNTDDQDNRERDEGNQHPGLWG
jgi:hypothetical protein